MEMAKLTKPQEAILKDLQRRFGNKSHGWQVPRRELDALDGRSLQGLFDRGYLRWNDHNSRNAAHLRPPEAA